MTDGLMQEMQILIQNTEPRGVLGHAMRWGGEAVLGEAAKLLGRHYAQTMDDLCRNTLAPNTGSGLTTTRTHDNNKQRAVDEVIGERRIDLGRGGCELRKQLAARTTDN